MLKKIASYLILAVCTVGEVYLLIPGGYDVFHGGVLHTFLGMLGILFFPIFGIFSVWFAFFYKDTKKANTSGNITEEIESISKISERRKENYLSIMHDLDSNLKVQFKKHLDSSKAQISRFETYLFNIRTLYTSLNHKTKINTFESESVIEGAIGIFYRRIESMIACIRLFDCNEYQDFLDGKLEFKSQARAHEKKVLFDKTFQQVDEILNSNEELILAVHRLLSALTEMGISQKWDNETIMATKKLNNYIKSTEGVTELNSEVGNQVMRLFDGELSMPKIIEKGDSNNEAQKCI